MKRIPIILILALILLFLTTSAYANQTYYRDSMITGKVVTPDIIFGSLKYRNNNGDYVTKANKTYLKIEPLYDRHLNELTQNIGNTVTLRGRMETGLNYGKIRFIYHDIKPIDYPIYLEKVYYYTTLKNISSSYGIQLNESRALADFLEVMQTASNWELKQDIDKNILKEIVQFKDGSLKYQWLLGKDRAVTQQMRKQIDNSAFIIGKKGNNILVNECAINKESLLEFISNGGSGTKPREKTKGIMTIYGRLSKLEINRKDKPNYIITGVAGNSLSDWLTILRNKTGLEETWELYPNKFDIPEDRNNMIWITGYRWEKRDENGKPTGIFYFSPKAFYNPSDIINGINNFHVITNGGLNF